jgi:hypothetical protein
VIARGNSFITQVETRKATPSTYLVLKIADLFAVMTDRLIDAR